MQVDEIIATYEEEFKNWQDKDYVIPFLTDYASCYYAYAKNNSKESIVLLSDEGLELLHSDISDFWNTIIAFYVKEYIFYMKMGICHMILKWKERLEKNITVEYLIGSES